MAYLIQVQAMEREALAIQAQAPFLDEGVQLPTAADVIAEFDAWLMSDPAPAVPATRRDAELAELYELLGVRGRG